MPALLIVQAAVSHREPYKAYQSAVQPLIQRFGGRLRASGANLEVLEGASPERRLVVFEFPSMEALQSFWRSPEYADVRRLRADAAQIDAWAVPAS